MSLPTSYQTADEYFDEALKFFESYQHLFNFANTEVLINDTFEQIDVNLDEIDVFDSDFDIKLIEDDYLQDFIAKLQRLQVVYEEFECDPNLSVADVPLGPKKKHEIMYLAKEIQHVCETVESDIVVDFGSGLGYLDQHIHEVTNYKVLGLECNETNYVGAKKRQKKYHENSINRVKYIKHRVTENSCEDIKQYLNDKFGDFRSFCITGLHACADLSVDSINIFLKMPEANALLLMPCCYHKMAREKSVQCKFENFPLSNRLKSAFDKLNAIQFLRVPFLRLAAQPPSTHENLGNLVFNLLARAVLEKYARKYDFKLKRRKRKAVKIKGKTQYFDNYLQDAINGFTLSRDESKDETENNFDLEEIFYFWRQISDLTFKKAGIFILLQNYLQPVFENFVLYDRLMYLKENRIDNCKYKKIFDEKLSPRCLVLTACK